jgi:hypothetical protein
MSVAVKIVTMMRRKTIIPPQVRRDFAEIRFAHVRVVACFDG